MTGLQLFRNRLSQHYKFYRRIKRLTVDWTVWVYVFIPFALMGASFYADLWLKVPTWPSFVSMETLILMIVLFIFSGSHYAFLHHADLLYLWQKTNLIKSLNQYRITYILVKMLIKVSLLMAVLSPIIMQYLNVELSAFISLSFIIYIWALSVSLIKRMLKVQLSKWSFRIAIALLASLSYGYFWFVLNGFINWAAYAVAIGTLFLVLIKVLKKSKHFEREIELDQDMKNKALQLILMQSAHIGAPDWMVQSKVRSSKKPWIFRKSQKIFQDNTPEVGYQELFIKTVLRRKGWILLYVQLTLSGVVLIVIFPGWYKIIIYFVLIYFLGQLIKSFWNQIITDPFLELFKWQQVNLTNVSRVILSRFIMPSALILSGVTGFALFSINGMMLMLILGWGITLFLARFLSRSVIM